MTKGMMALIRLAVICAVGGVYTTDVLAKGDPDRGARVARVCKGCHGADGNSPTPTYPKLGGQHEEYILLALEAYRDGIRDDAIMKAPVIDLSQQDLEDVAAYYASQASGFSDTKRQQKQGKGPAPTESAAAQKFEIDDRLPVYTSLLAKATQLDQAAQKLAALNGAPTCTAPDASRSQINDSDKDGVADAYDAAPDNANEFVVDGNRDGFFEICNVHQLQAIYTLGSGDGQATELDLQARLTRDYQLAQDLDGSDLSLFEPIGNCGEPNNCMITLDKFGYKGTFDGRGHVIRNLTINKPEQGGTGIFGVLGMTGVVMNLNVENVEVTGRGGVALVVGSNFGVVYNTSASGKITGSNAIGGLVGGSAGLVVYSYAKAEISGEKAIGGLVGDMNGAVFYSSAQADIKGIKGLGGLVGLNTYGYIQSSYATGKVDGVDNVGGLVGVNTDADVLNSYSTASVTGTSLNASGLVAFNSYSRIKSSYASGPVKGKKSVGGLAGTNNGLILNSYTSSSVQGDEDVGEVFGTGHTEGKVTQSFSAGDAQGSLAALTGVSSGWMPEQPPMTDLLAYYCDLNNNGFIDFGERMPPNTVWDFGGAKDLPALRCTPDGIAVQR